MERRLAFGVHAPGLRSVHATGAMDGRLALCCPTPKLVSLDIIGTGGEGGLSGQRLSWEGAEAGSSWAEDGLVRRDIFDSL